MLGHIRRRRRAVCTVTAATALAVVGVVAAAVATPPGQNGDIAFRRYLGPERTKGAIFLARGTDRGNVSSRSRPREQATTIQMLRPTAVSSHFNAAAA
jgi:hypothetical protein